MSSNTFAFESSVFFFAGSPSRPSIKTKTEGVMQDSANRFLDSLTPDQRAGTQLEFDGKDRTMWHYYPERGSRTNTSAIATASCSKK